MMKTKPKRIQRKRTKGWRMPKGVIYVGRGSKWGNPFYVKKLTDCCGTSYHVFDKNDLGVADFYTKEQAAKFACELYQQALDDGNLAFSVEDVKRELANKDLCCWCKIEDECHGDILLAINNK